MKTSPPDSSSSQTDELPSGLTGDVPSRSRALLSFLLPPLGLVFFLADWPRFPRRAQGTGRALLGGAAVWALAFFALLVAIPALADFRESNHRFVCSENLTIANIALQSYIGEHHGRLPDLSSPAKLQADLLPHLGDASGLICSQSGPYVGNAAYSHRRVKDIAKPETVVLLHDAGYPHKKGRNALYADGVVRFGVGREGG